MRSQSLYGKNVYLRNLSNPAASIVHPRNFLEVLQMLTDYPAAGVLPPPARASFEKLTGVFGHGHLTDAYGIFLNQ